MSSHKTYHATCEFVDMGLLCMVHFDPSIFELDIVHSSIYYPQNKHDKKNGHLFYLCMGERGVNPMYIVTTPKDKGIEGGGKCMIPYILTIFSKLKNLFFDYYKNTLGNFKHPIYF